MKQTKKQEMKKGISLIVLIITLISTYDERIKTDIKPPKNKIIDENKVVGCKLTTFNISRGVYYRYS